MLKWIFFFGEWRPTKLQMTRSIKLHRHNLSWGNTCWLTLKGSWSLFPAPQKQLIWFKNFLAIISIAKFANCYSATIFVHFFLFYANFSVLFINFQSSRTRWAINAHVIECFGTHVLSSFSLCSGNMFDRIIFRSVGTTPVLIKIEIVSVCQQTEMVGPVPTEILRYPSLNSMTCR